MPCWVPNRPPPRLQGVHTSLRRWALGHPPAAVSRRTQSPSVSRSDPFRTRWRQVKASQTSSPRLVWWANASLCIAWTLAALCSCLRDMATSARVVASCANALHGMEWRRQWSGAVMGAVMRRRLKCCAAAWLSVITTAGAFYLVTELGIGPAGNSPKHSKRKRCPASIPERVDSSPSSARRCTLRAEMRALKCCHSAGGFCAMSR